MPSLYYDYKKRFIIDQLGDDYLQSGGELRYKCPVCKEQGKTYDDYKLYVSIDKGVYWCHRCHSTGHLEYDPLLIEGSYSQNSHELIDNLIKKANSNDLDKDVDLGLYRIPATEPEPGTLSWNYIMTRKLTPIDISRHHIRVGNLASPNNFRGRFVIPNELTSNLWTDMYVARSFTNSPRRYLNPPLSKSHASVFNLNLIEDNPHYIIINEGVINSIIAGRYSVATFGKYVSNGQLSKIIRKHPNNIFVSLDYDAREDAIKLCERISHLSGGNIKVYLVNLPDGIDASDLGHDNYMELVTKSTEYVSKSRYMIQSYFDNLINK